MSGFAAQPPNGVKERGVVHPKELDEKANTSVIPAQAGTQDPALVRRPIVRHRPHPNFPLRKGKGLGYLSRRQQAREKVPTCSRTPKGHAHRQVDTGLRRTDGHKKDNSRSRW